MLATFCALLSTTDNRTRLNLPWSVALAPALSPPCGPNSAVSFLALFYYSFLPPSLLPQSISFPRTGFTSPPPRKILSPVRLLVTRGFLGILSCPNEFKSLCCLLPSVFIIFHFCTCFSNYFLPPLTRSFRRTEAASGLALHVIPSTWLLYQLGLSVAAMAYRNTCLFLPHQTRSKGKENHCSLCHYGTGDPMMIRNPGVFYFIALHGLPLALMSFMVHDGCSSHPC